MLPKMIDPRRNADQDIEYQESMQASLLPRFVEAVGELKEDVSVRIHLFRDEQNRMRLRGEAEVPVSMACQRCMQPSRQAVRTEIDLVIVYSEDQAKALPKELDAWVAEESANLHELIEDELLLALPIVAYHSTDECSLPEELVSQRPEETLERQSPFAVLRDLSETSK